MLFSRNFILSSLCFIIILFSLFQFFGRLSDENLSISVVDRHRTSHKNQVSNEIFNATLGFEKIFAINLPARTDKKDALILATALSDIHVEFVDGVNNVSEKALPSGYNTNLRSSDYAAWRSHLNVISGVVQEKLSSALIFEDDVDWDIRLKLLLSDFAKSVVVLQQEPLRGRQAAGGDYNFDNLPTTKPTYSPYGDDWDLLWLGHCGMQLNDSSVEAKVIHEDDDTVLERTHQKSFGEISPLDAYSNNTRVTTHVHDGKCTLAYAVSQKGAQKLLYDIGLGKLTGPFDDMVSKWCEGKGWPKEQRCYGVIPQLFDHHRAAGPSYKDSDNSRREGGAWIESVTSNIMWSVRENMARLLEGRPGWDDQSYEAY